MHAYSDGPSPPNLVRAQAWEGAIPYDVLPVQADAAGVLLRYPQTAAWAVSLLTPQGLVPLVRLWSLVGRS